MRNKYGAIKTKYNGVMYASKLEARCAAYLDVLKKAGEITAINRQVAFVLLPKPNLVKYVADFLVYLPDGTKKVVEAKGIWTSTAKLKNKMFKHFYPDIKLEIYTK